MDSMSVDRDVARLRQAIDETEQQLRVCRYRQRRTPALERRQACLQERLTDLRDRLAAALWAKMSERGTELV